MGTQGSLPCLDSPKDPGLSAVFHAPGTPSHSRSPATCCEPSPPIPCIHRPHYTLTVGLAVEKQHRAVACRLHSLRLGCKRAVAALHERGAAGGGRRCHRTAGVQRLGGGQRQRCAGTVVEPSAKRGRVAEEEGGGLGLAWPGDRQLDHLRSQGAAEVSRAGEASEGKARGAVPLARPPAIVVLIDQTCIRESGR